MIVSSRLLIGIDLGREIMVETLTRFLVSSFLSTNSSFSSANDLWSSNTV